MHVQQTTLTQSLLALIAETSSRLPADVLSAVRRAQNEENGPLSRFGFSVLENNLYLAQEACAPICQDTGFPTFWVKASPALSPAFFRKAAQEALAEATRTGLLRPNAVDALTGVNSGNNLGEGLPNIHWEIAEEDTYEVRLLLKGGGCENQNAQYSLPCELKGLGLAERTMEGVRKCVLHAIWQAQGQGCSPGFTGVCIGGDRAMGYEAAKQQLLRPLEDINPDPELRDLEDWLTRSGNKLGIGVMGLGGRGTLLSCKAAKRHRLPASFFVTVAYNCWALRRQGLQLDPETGKVLAWLYPREEVTKTSTENIPRIRTLRPPLAEETVRSLRVGDIVKIDGPLFTARDAAHQYLLTHEPPVDLSGQVLYHCGPVMLRENGTWRVAAAGPTTSSREEPFEAKILRQYGVRAILGKGGMGESTLKALRETGAVYLSAIGGAGQTYARALPETEDVHLLELGIPEALWRFRSEGLLAIVTMDAHGNSLHEDVLEASRRALADIDLKG